MGVWERRVRGWLKGVCEVVRGVYEEVVGVVVGWGYVEGEERRIRVMRKGKGKGEKEYVWMVRGVMEKVVMLD